MWRGSTDQKLTSGPSLRVSSIGHLRPVQPGRRTAQAGNFRIARQNEAAGEYQAQLFTVHKLTPGSVTNHPQVHCVVPAGGLSRDHARWIRSRPRFFLPIAVLRRVFRGKFVASLLKSAFERRQLHLAGVHLAGELAPPTHPKFFAAWLRLLFRKDCIVYSKPPFGGPDYVLQYLGRYTHHVAISNHRLVALADG